MNSTDQEYFRLLCLVLEKGRLKKNRTGVDTLGVFGAQARFDLQRGLPILTTKKIFTKAVIHELLWFLSGSTNIKYLVDNDVHIWDEWGCKRWMEKTGAKGHIQALLPIYLRDMKADPEFAEQWGELGYGTYGSTWTAFEVPPIPVEVTPRLKKPEPSYNYAISEELRGFIPEGKDGLIGKSFETKASGWMRVICRGVSDKQGRPVYTVQFTKTNYRTQARADAIRTLRVADPYYPAVAGVGFIGSCRIKTSLDKILYKAWSHMLNRCYNKNCKEYPYYGAKGVFVCNRWFSFERFRQDVELLPNWREKSINFRGYQLDKDYYHSNCYSPDTCVWLKNSENRRYQKKNANQFRLPLPVNQIQKVLDKLKSNPDDRRLIVSAWHPYWVDHCALPPCHCLFQFHTEELTLEERWALNTKMVDCKTDEAKKNFLDGIGMPTRRLNCQLYQRSCDLGLGIPFNIASYSILLSMVAHVTSMVAGEFIHTFGDLHIYQPHLPNLKIQMEREPYPSPTLWLNPAVKDLFSFKYEDIKILNYQCHPKLNFEVAV